MSSNWLERRKQLEGAVSACHPKNRHRAPSTKKQIQLAKDRWLAFCQEVEPIAIENASLVDFKLHIEWYLENSTVKYLSSLETSWKYLALYYACETGLSMNSGTSKEIKAVSL